MHSRKLRTYSRIYFRIIITTIKYIGVCNQKIDGMYYQILSSQENLHFKA